jgi:UDP-N-acetylmuramoyl-tripeptide--D-alanyl-D-alanine ligase
VAAFALTSGMVAEATGGQLTAGAASTTLPTVSTDTRHIAPGALFIALRGERFDGHEFIAEALARGAAGLLVAADVSAPADIAVIRVDDTLVGLQCLGQYVRRLSGARVVAVTGSAGKTSTKEIAAAILASRYRVYRNEGNLNNHIGLPLSLLELRHEPEIAVVELGMNHPGEIRRLVELAEPEVRVWINVGDAHIGHFGTRDAVADAKGEILEYARTATLLVSNADDPLVAARAARFPGRRLSFGIVEAADVRAVEIDDAGIDGSTAVVQTPAGRVDLQVALPGRAQLMNVLAAVAVAVEFGVPSTAIAAAVRAVRPVARRGAVISLRDGARLVDDSYNASPAAVQAMLAALGQTIVAGRRLAVLGEMRELGDGARELHERCGRAAVDADVDELVVIGGPAADGIVDGAADAGLPPMRIHKFATSEAAAEAVPALIGPSDLVLVKGSRGTRTDIVADRIKRELGVA